MNRVKAKQQSPLYLWGFDKVTSDPAAWSKLLDTIGARPEPKWRKDARCFAWLGRGVIMMTEFNPLTGASGPGGPNERNVGKVGTIGLSGTPQAVQQATRAVKQNAKYKAETPGKIAIGSMEMTTNAASSGHHFFDGKNYHADTAFLNGLKSVSWPGGSLEHMGFGEFYFKTPEGDIQFDRTRGKDFPGKSGRSHKVYDDKGGKLVKKLIELMEKKGQSELVQGAAKAGSAQATIQALTTAATLFNHGLDEEAIQVVAHAFNVRTPNRKVVAGLQALRKPPDDDEYGFFEAVLKKGLRVGYDEGNMEGAIDVGDFGDIYFALDDDKVYLWINDGLRDKTNSQEFGIKNGIKAILAITDLFKKVRAR